VTVDAFTEKPFSGNPAAVCILTGENDDDDGWMQKVAREMNLSETAFLRRRSRVGGGRTDSRRRGRARSASFGLRWFTPIVEVDLCGHATIASSHVLWEGGHVAPDHRIRFHTKSGVLTAERREEGSAVWIELDFPALPETPTDDSARVISRALGTRPKYVGRYSSDFLVEIEDEEVLRRMVPDFALLKTLPGRGVAVTCSPTASTKAMGYDFVSRFFAPKVGIDEDPVTGSSHCCLGPYWARRLGKDEVLAYKAYARCGSVRVKVLDDRVMFGGRAVTVMRGKLEV
jgi:PhzF family phenazine biosynthesis protein